MPISQIEKMKKQNNLDSNVFALGKDLIVFRLSEQHEAMPKINPLLIEKLGFTTHG